MCEVQWNYCTCSWGTWNPYCPQHGRANRSSYYVMACRGRHCKHDFQCYMNTVTCNG